MSKRTPQQRIDDLDHDLWIEIVHCENCYETAAATAKSFGVPLATVRAVYAQQRKQRKQRLAEILYVNALDQHPTPSV